MKKVIIFGGSFNPIHNTHLDIAKKASKALSAEVWFDVANKPRWKENYPSKKVREELVKLAIEGETQLKICEEIPESEDTTYTFDTMLYLKDKYPDYSFYFLVGTDQVNMLDKWYEIDELAKLVQFVYVKRTGYKLNKGNFEKYNLIDVGLVGSKISSTEIRDGNLNDTPQCVVSRIKEQGLYFENTLKKILSDFRYQHSIRVAEVAVDIAKANNLNINKAYVAGLIHDCAKELNKEEALKLMKIYYPQYINDNPRIYHQFLARIIAKKYFDIDDEEILDAIEYHTTGKHNMSKLGMTIYCADKIEPGREYKEQNFLIERCLENIEAGYAYTVLHNDAYYKEKHIVNTNPDYNDTLEDCMKAKELYEVQMIVKTLDDRFANDITIIDVSNRNPLAKYYINCSAIHERIINALGENVIDIANKYKLDFHHIEGRNDANWTLVDLTNVVVNIFKASARENYNLEKMYLDETFYEVEEVLKWKLFE